MGATVTVLERNRCGKEASWAGAGILSPLLPWDYPDPVTQLTQFSNGLFAQFIEGLWTKTGIDPEYQASGMLVLSGFAVEPQEETRGESEDELNPAVEAWCIRHGFPIKRVHSHEIEPMLARHEAALWLPEVCQVRNPRLL